MPYLVLFARTGNKTQTAYLDRAVNYLVKGGVTEIRHIRRRGVLTVTADGTIVLTEATPRGAQHWKTEAAAVGVHIEVDARIQRSRRRPKMPKLNPKPTQNTQRRRDAPGTPPVRTFRHPGEPFKRDAADVATVLIPRRGRVAVTEFPNHGGSA